MTAERHGTGLRFVLDPTSGVPFYRQIIMQIEMAIADGRLSTGTQLPTEALIPALFVVVAAKGLAKGRISFLKSRLWIPVLLYAAYFAVTVRGTRFPLVTVKAILRDWTHIAGGFALALLILRDRRDLERLLRFAAVATTILVLYGLFTQVH